MDSFSFVVRSLELTIPIDFFWIVGACLLGLLSNLAERWKVHHRLGRWSEKLSAEKTPWLHPQIYQTCLENAYLSTCRTSRCHRAPPSLAFYLPSIPSTSLYSQMLTVSDACALNPLFFSSWESSLFVNSRGQIKHLFRRINSFLYVQYSIL